MQPFPLPLWARLQATHGSLRQGRVTGQISVTLAYQGGVVTSWDIRVSEHQSVMSSDMLRISCSSGDIGIAIIPGNVRENSS
jgi:hypothetical protein